MGVGVGEEGKKSLLVDGWKRWDLEERSGCHGRVDVMVGGSNTMMAAICSTSFTPCVTYSSTRKLSSTSISPISSLSRCTSSVRRTRSMIVCMAPDEEKLTRRNPLDFPVEWERPKPGRRPDIFPQFSPMKTPLPPPLPYDPSIEEDEEEDENKEEEEDPDNDDQPDK